MVRSLADVREGSTVTISDLSEADDLLKRRLYDLGVEEGAVIRLCRCLPFGGPLMIECDGMCIGLRRCEAPRIGVKSPC